MYDLNSNNQNPVINYDGVSKNVTAVGFHEEGKWMYTGNARTLFFKLLDLSPMR